VIEHHRDDAHQVSILEFLVLELAEKVPTRLTNSPTATSIAVIACELVDPSEQFLRHRDADNAHITTWLKNIKIIIFTNRS
jgi:hypothetical protein